MEEQYAVVLTEAEIEECCRGESEWICPVCKKTLSRKQTLKVHLNSVHSVKAGNASKRYKLYEHASTAKIPRSTLSRWNLERGTQNESADHDIDSVVEETGAPSSSVNHVNKELEKFSPSSHNHDNDNSNFSPGSQLDGAETPVNDVIDVHHHDHGSEEKEHEHGEERTGDNFQLVDMDLSGDSSTDESSSDESESSTDMTEEDGALHIDSPQGPPLYVYPPSNDLQKSEISHHQHMLLLCAYAISQKLSGVAFQQLLDVVKFHLPENSICEVNVLELKEKLANEEVVFYDICRICGSLFKDHFMTCKTPGCGGKRITDSADKKRMCFATSNCVEQLKNILQRHGNMDKIKDEIEKRVTDADNSSICDVSSGIMYKELCKSGNFLCNSKQSMNITLTWNTDGIPLFKSSSVSLWPVYLAINELPPRERFLKKNLVVWGIWQGNGKPSMNTFLSPFVKEMMDIFHNGFYVEETKCHAMLLLGSMDLQARAYVLNFSQHNGASSCLYCEDNGKVVKSGKGHCRCFPYNEDNVLRTKTSINEAAASAVSSGKTTKGFHGKSVLSCLPFFEPQQHIVIDYMHGVLLGINKKLFSLWFDAKYHKEDYFIGDKLEDIDHLVKNLKPPYLVHRLPRKLKNNYHRWKASEVRSWFLFYSIPCLQGFLPEPFLQHYACLVEGIHLLLLECISAQNLRRAKTLLHTFYKNSTDLYGDNFSGLNVHNVRHYADFVEMWGPLWAWSCFGFESCNGEMLQAVHGKGNVCAEIFWSLHAEKKIEMEVKTMPNGPVKSYFQKVLLRNSRKLPKTSPAYQCEIILPLQDLVVEDDLLRDMNTLSGDDESFARVLKVVRHGFLFYSKACTRVIKRNSHTALLETATADGARVIIISHFLVNKKTLAVFAVGRKMRLVGPAISGQCCHIQKVEQIQRRISLVPAQLLKEPVVYIAKQDEEFIACFPNFVEMD